MNTMRPEHVKRFRRENIKAVNARKEVVAGIEQVGRMFKTDTLKIVKESTERFQKEIFMYVWNEKTGDPVKEWDDVMDALRYAIYTHNYRDIIRGKR